MTCKEKDIVLIVFSTSLLGQGRLKSEQGSYFTPRRKRAINKQATSKSIPNFLGPTFEAILHQLRTMGYCLTVFTNAQRAMQSTMREELRPLKHLRVPLT